MKEKNKVIAASIIGNALELYDFSLYGIFLPLLTTLFFPTNNPLSSLLASLGTFAVGFIIRPFGGIFFGHLGDRFGRRNALSLSIFLMAIPTLVMGFLPTYSEIGLLAPIILVLCRLLQGLCAGGEYSGASIFIIEHLEKSKSGFAGALISASGALGSLFAMLLGSMILNSDLPSWSWRIPFLMGAALAFIGFYIRRNLHESPEFKEEALERTISQSPLIKAFQYYPISILRSFAIGAFANVLANTLVVYLNIYLTKVVGIPLKHSMFFNSMSLLIVIFAIPLMGWLSDKINQKIIMRTGALLLIFSIYPFFLMLNSGKSEQIIFVQISLALIISCFLGPSNAFMNQLFPSQVRYSGIAFGYCWGMALVGGTMPLISTYMIEILKTKMAPAYYLIFCAVIGLLGTYKVSFPKGFKA